MKHSFLFLILAFTAQCCANPIPSGAGLSIVAPTTITVPGNYRLANDISGIITIAANNVCLDLENKKITAGFNGIVVSGQTEVSIKNGVIESAAATGLFVEDCINVEIVSMDLVGNATGICLLTSTGITIKESTCRNNSDDGIALNTSIDCVIYKNQCFNNENGIKLLNSSSGNTISENTCNDNSFCNGIDLSNFCTNNIISENNCIDNDNHGIFLFNLCNNNTILENNCKGNVDGIALSNSDLNTLSENICDSNTSDGIDVSSDSTGNQIKENQTYNNGSFGIRDSGIAGNNEYIYNYSSNNTTNYSPASITQQQTKGASPIMVGSNYSDT